MWYKISNAFFIVTTVVFAVLYFSQPEPLIQSNEHKLAENPERKNNIVPSHKSVDGVNSAQADSVKRVSANIREDVERLHPELSNEDIDILYNLKKSWLASYGRGYEKRHGMLFERLILGDDRKEEFLNLTSERNMIYQMRAPRGESDDVDSAEKEEFELKKQSMLAYVDDKIRNVLGNEAGVYFNYREKSNQYRTISRFKDKMTKQGDFSVETQDRLAQLMFESRRTHDDAFGNDWEYLSQFPDKADDFLKLVEERYAKLANDAGFLSPEQQETFSNHLKESYRSYQSWVNRQKRRNN